MVRQLLPPSPRAVPSVSLTGCLLVHVLSDQETAGRLHGGRRLAVGEGHHGCKGETDRTDAALGWPTVVGRYHHQQWVHFGSLLSSHAKRCPTVLNPRTFCSSAPPS